MDETSFTIQPRVSRGEYESSEDNFGGDDDFDIDRLIDERKSERSRRSSSGSRSET
jgi:hypothetical protein